MSSRARTILTIVAVLLVLSSLGVALWLVYLASAAIAKTAGVIAAAVIALVGTLMTAILNHANQLDAQRKQAALTAKQDREQAAFMAKQDNYKELLSKVGAFARDDEPYSEAGDQLSSAHLASWAFGDLRVLESTNKFQQDPDQGTLLDLLEAVRDSLGYQENLSKDLIRDRYKYDPEILFPEGRKKGLRSGKEQESASEPPKPPSGVLFVDKQSQKVLEEKVAQQHDQIEQLHDKIDQLLQAGQNEEVENKDNSEESETGNRGHTTSLMDTQPRPRPQVDASEDTKMREPPVNGAKPDTGMEEKDEPTSHPRWQVWKYLGF